MQRNSTAVTTFELHINGEVDNDNKLYKWYEKSMVRIVNGTKSPESRHLCDYVKHHRIGDIMLADIVFTILYSVIYQALSSLINSSDEVLQ